MDLPEPPNVVFSQPAPCSDARQADDLLKRALAPSVAPRGAWTVTMRVTQSGSTLTAEGEITDESDAPVAHRTLAKDSRECGALARAVGVWASLVLDAEVERAQNLPPPPPPVAPRRPQRSSVAAHEPEKALESGTAVEGHSLEIGVGGLYLDGLLGSSAPPIVGASMHVIVEGPSGWYLRPTLALGRSTGVVASGDIYATWGAARFDACKRMTGNYLDRRGIQVDMCGGTDLGFLFFDAASAPGGSGTQRQTSTAIDSRTLPLFSPGGSLALRGGAAP